MAWDWLSEQMDGASDVLTNPGMIADVDLDLDFDNLADMGTGPLMAPDLDFGLGGLGDLIDMGTGPLTAGSDAVDGALDTGRSVIDGLGHNFTGFAASLLEHGTKAGSGLSKLGSGAGMIAGPAALISGALGLYDDFTGEDEVDANSVAANFFGAGGGLASTIGAIGTAMGGTAGGAGTAGAMASAGPVGAVVGAGAAGLTGGHYLAKFADSEYGQDEDGLTEYDKVARDAVALDEWISGNNYETGEQGHWARRALGTTAGIGYSAVGGIGAGLSGGATALWNWATD